MRQPYYEDEAVTLYHGDVRERLRGLEAESVNCVVTSPPYWSLRDYGTQPSVWGADDPIYCERPPVFVNRALHDWRGIERQDERYTGKVKWQHIGEEARAAGVQIRDFDENAWSHPKGTDTAQCSRCGAWLGALGLEPTIEMYVAHMVEVFREVRRVLRPDGTLWLNLGDSYVGDRSGARDAGRWPKQSRNNGGVGIGSKTGTGLKQKDLCGIPWRVALALQEDGWWLRSDIIWAKPNPMPESAKDRPTKSHEYVFLLTKRSRYYYDGDAIREPAVSDHTSGNGFKRDARLSYQNPDGSARGSDEEWDDVGGSRNKRSVWTVPTAPFSEAHFATFPPKLIEPCILAGAPEGGVVLDPFIGSGTTAMVARKLRRRAVGIDLNAEYLDMAIGRVTDVQVALV